jgi:hypothetical protein
MKMVCIDNSNEPQSLIIGKIYECVHGMTGFLHVWDEKSNKRSYNIKRFVKIEEYRKETLKILLK